MATKRVMKENLQCTSKYGHLRISQDNCHVGWQILRASLPYMGIVTICWIIRYNIRHHKMFSTREAFSQVGRSEVEWSEVEWSGVKWSGVKWSEVKLKWDEIRLKIIGSFPWNIPKNQNRVWKTLPVVCLLCLNPFSELLEAVFGDNPWYSV